MSSKKKLDLAEIRDQLIRLEETIIFALIERAQFPRNPKIYEPLALTDKFSCSYLEFFLRETEKVHSLMRRYACQEEHPFTEFSELPDPIFFGEQYPEVLKSNNINFNKKVYSLYIDKIIPMITKEGNDDFGSSSHCDIIALQAISKRVHYGKFVVESKFQQDVEGYTKLILEKDFNGLMDKLTDVAVENRLLDRVRLKASTYGQDPTQKGQANFKVDPEVPVKIYKDYLIPLTKEIELEYIIRRLDGFTIAYFGATSSFSHVAAKSHFTESSANFVSFTTIPQVFSAVLSSKADYGVIPIRNSVSGLFRASHEMLFTTILKVVGEIKNEVKLHLLSTGDLADVSVIYSHPDAITQCQKSLLRLCPTAKTIPVTSTTAGASMAATTPNSAAICHRDVTQQHPELKLISTDIQDDERSYTRFLILSRTGDHVGPSGSDKTILVFGVQDKPGGLTAALGCFEKYGLNLLSIESQFIGNAPSFLVEFDGHSKESRVVDALKNLSEHTTFVRVVGSFPHCK